MTVEKRNDGELLLKFFVPVRTGRGENNREHPQARARRVKAEHQAVFYATIGPRRAVLAALMPAPVVVTLTRVSPGPGLDAVNDRDKRVSWKYAPQERGPWGHRGAASRPGGRGEASAPSAAHGEARRAPGGRSPRHTGPAGERHQGCAGPAGDGQARLRGAPEVTMSGHPSEERVRQLIALMDELAKTETAITAKAPLLESLGKELGLLSGRKAQLQGALKRSLEEMDVDSPGNIGWGARVGWLLAEFRRQLLTGAGASGGEA